MSHYPCDLKFKRKIQEDGDLFSATPGHGTGEREKKWYLFKRHFTKIFYPSYLVLLKN